MRNNPRSKQYPVWNRDLLLAHPSKGNKPQDIERIFTSERSEDYVTWNILQGLRSSPLEQWWSEFVRLVRADNSDFTLEYQRDDLPALEAWRRCKSPSAYEQWSRIRMAQSDNPAWIVRSQNKRAVEGDSEVDLVISGRSYLIFIEAKLESDISLSTTYDPDRNQIVRNIDILLEQCGTRMPGFLVLVKDQRQEHRYVQLLQTYQQNPTVLAEALPHRALDSIVRIASNTAILLWKDVLALVKYLPDDVRAELERRIAD